MPRGTTKLYGNNGLGSRPDQKPKMVNITCPNCYNQFPGTPNSATYSCTFCKAKISVEESETVREEPLQLGRTSVEKGKTVPEGPLQLRRTSVEKDETVPEGPLQLRRTWVEKSNIVSPGLDTIICPNCYNQFPGTPHSPTHSCKFCKAKISVEKSVIVPKGSLQFRWTTKMDGSSSLCSTPDQKPKYTKCSTCRHHPKKAVLCGVSYTEKKYKLKGMVNDVTRMKSLLVDHFYFPENAIRVLTEEQSDPSFIPTKKNIQKALSWLVEDCKSGDSLVFYFSGHGLRQPDFSHDEIDGYDETICPSDFMTAGMIVDNDINTTIVKPLKKGVKLHAIVDACHSGTILDLEHVYNHKEKRWDNNKPPSGASKGTNGGLAISLSVCAVDQMAADTSAFTGKEMTGVLTFLLVQMITENPHITYGDLLNKINEKIVLANIKGCLNPSFLKRLFRRDLPQECQLSSSKMFDVNKEEFKL